MITNRFYHTVLYLRTHGNLVINLFSAKFYQLNLQFSKLKETIEQANAEEEDDDYRHSIEIHDGKTVESKQIKQTIKSASKFSKYFIDIKKALKLNDDGQLENKLFYPDYVKFLLDKYMPYCFLWAGFVLNGIKDIDGNQITRLTNGTVENFFGKRKRIRKI